MELIQQYARQAAIGQHWPIERWMAHDYGTYYPVVKDDIIVGWNCAEGSNDDIDAEFNLDLECYEL